jgi:sterol desaturase/sphingolipid hydroxylase (fatty acid hydroxylase superfamily)
MIGYGIDDFIVVRLVALMIGHLNHGHINLPYGPFRFILNNPRMHIWHHMAQNPADKPHGVNFGISLSIWDYIFRTSHIPKSGRDIELGFENVDKFPQGFVGQNLWPFCKQRADHG